MAYRRITTRHATDFVRKLQREAKKAHFVYDGLTRMIEVYEALIDAKDGDDCLKTSYFFIGDSFNYDYLTEELVEWDTAWERTRP